jgi:hypothetical protein
MTDVVLTPDEERLLLLMETGHVYNTPEHTVAYWAEAMDCGALYTSTLLADLAVKGMLGYQASLDEPGVYWASEAGLAAARELRGQEIDRRG